MLTGTFMLSCNTDNNNHNKDEILLSQDMKLEEVKENRMKFGESADSTTVVHPSQTTDVLHAGRPIPDWDKKIIKTANITLELNDFNAYHSSFHKTIKHYEAYIAGEEQLQSDERIENIVTIKVPVLKFEDLLNSITGDGIKVISRRISTEDATGEVVDTKARIDAKKQVRARYMELLQQAKSMKDILQVQQEINTIQEELEAADGRVKYLTSQAAYSTIHLVYYQYKNGATGKSGEPGFFSKLQSAFRNGSNIISSGILLIVTIWPLLLVAFVIWLLIKRWKYAAIPLIKKQ